MLPRHGSGRTHTAWFSREARSRCKRFAWHPSPELSFAFWLQRRFHNQSHEIFHHPLQNIDPCLPTDSCCVPAPQCTRVSCTAFPRGLGSTIRRKLCTPQIDAEKKGEKSHISCGLVLISRSMGHSSPFLRRTSQSNPHSNARPSPMDLSTASLPSAAASSPSPSSLLLEPPLLILPSLLDPVHSFDPPDPLGLLGSLDPSIFPIPRALSISDVPSTIFGKMWPG
jgi:hypothetical protein